MLSRSTIFGCLGLALLAPLLACDEDLTPREKVDAGPVVPTDGGPTTASLPPYAPPGAILGESLKAFNTTLNTWAVMDGAKVKQVSWDLPLTAVTALEGTTFYSRIWMNLPAQATGASAHRGFAYDFIPLGHAPIGVYTTPHWEFHVIFQNFAAVKAIDCADPTLPASEIIPPNYLVLPPPDNCVFGMGLHAIDLGAPEFNKEKFTTTNLLVYYKGDVAKEASKIVSSEPKVTNDVLRARKSFTIKMPVLPAGSLGRPDLAPSKLEAVYESAHDVYIITLSDYVQVN